MANSQTPNPKLVTIFVVGDSTANNHADGGLGWGDPFISHFDATKVNVLNRARAGRSSRTFITEGLWDQVLSEMKRGDFVLIQFGHNDAGKINDDTRARGSLPGTGEETQEIDNLLTKKHEIVHTYGWYMRKMIADTKAKGAVPIVLSLTVRNIWKEGRVERGSGKFGQWASEVAQSQNVQFIDLTKIIADRYEELGQEKVEALFGPDHTHTSFAGAELNAELVVAGLRTLEFNPIGPYFFTSISLPDVISDGMVLQQKQRVPVWGMADPGEAVTVRFAGQTKKTIASADGKWIVKLDPLHANATPATMIISGKKTIELKDILVGEVWLVAGQSNMQRLLSETDNGEAAIAAADHPRIRLFNVSRQVAFRHATPPLARWLACSPETVKEFSAAGYYFGVELEKELRVPIGLINSSYGGSQAEAWTPVEYLLASDDLRPTVERKKIWNEERPRVRVEYDEAIKKWRAEADKAVAAGARPSPSPAVPDALREYRVASSIYNGMIEPLIPFHIRGAIWYQGESNEARAQQYGLLLPTMIKSWRERWGEGDFPFGIVQLPNYRAQKPEPADEPWSHVREAQRRTALNTTNTGLIVTIDIGEARDIHPKNKLDVGKRMARWALADVYDRKLTKSGPVFREAKIAGSKIVVKFDEAGAGLKIRDGDKLDEFAIAGADGKWSWANAKITGKNAVEVWSDAVPQPVAVRYAFNNNPRHPNLTNETGLPAGPFRTDNWPGPTDGKK